MNIKLEMLRVFRVVAEKGNLAGAADALGRTPSAVSMTLAQLEDEIGAPLFEADRKNRLSPLGQFVLDESARATDAFARSLGAIRRHAASVAGTVRVAAVPSATVTVLPGVIAAFRAERPDVRLEISDVDSEAVRRRVMLDEADIGIISSPIDDDADGLPILEDDLGIACRSDGPIAHHVRSGDAASWDLLRLEPMVANPLCQLVRHPGVAEALASCNLEARNTSALLSFIRAGLGASVLPRSAVATETGELSFVAPNDPQTRRALRKISNPERRFSPAVGAFWAAL
ncbi:LysR family transcriptional regulator [Ruegeria sediminis]|uniref:LysR family transcriptional regulator n=1 Tax=Ruegeria sediminis TaxID=2583820 RepID=A0ABY2WUD0_9RHOB|nr:LysR family transcriptional regulator [Ruegeria sediminis]TMV05633.1 LysR family transcriptional regulator [Ruegeria sediminis]